MRQHTGIVGLRDTPERQIKLRVIASRNPHRRAIAVGQRMIIPGVTARFAGLRDGFESPGFLPGFRIKGDDVIPASHTPTGADHDFVFCDQRPAGELETFVGSERLVPRNLAGLHIERDDVDIRSAEVDLVAVDCYVAFYARVRMLSEQIAGYSIRLFAESMDEHDSVADQRRGFIGARRKRPGPRHAQVVHI